MLENNLIFLRALEPEDLENLYRWENNTAYWHGGDTRVPYSRFVLKQYILSADKDIYQNRQIRFIIELKATGEAIGAVDLYDFDIFNSRIALGILIDEAFQGKGFASMSFELIIEYVFDFLKISQIYSYVAANNEKSKVLFEKSGFEKTAVLKRWIRVKNDFVDVFVYQLFNSK